MLEELGRGGMGVVCKARHVGLNRLVAVKSIRDGSRASPAELTRFHAEAEAVFCGMRIAKYIAAEYI